MSFNIPEPYTQVAVDYSSLAGIDLSSDSREIKKSRASKCVNMYRCYNDGSGSFLQTRPGFELLGDFGGRIYGLHFINTEGKNSALVHAGSNLFIWSAFPSAPTESDLVSVYTMAEQRSVSFSFGGRLYILDGQSYLCFHDGKVAEVEGFVPTTRIAAAPLGDSENYQSVNLLSPMRKNSFRGDGSSKVYYLDAQDIDSVASVYVNDTLVSAYTVDTVAGTVTFTTAPDAPALGDDNVVITYKKETEGYKERITGCRIACVFDNRVFFSGNKEYPGLIFHSELNDPAFIADINYYDDGDGSVNISALAVKENKLTVIKERGSNAVYTHTPALSYDLGRVYPANAGTVSLGCKTLNGAYLFRDDLVYLSEQGLEGIGDIDDTNYQRSLHHRSTMADGGLLCEDTENASIACWQGYLCILTGERMYLADSRNVYYNDSSFEYEWYLWQGLYAKEASNTACILGQWDNSLYFGTAEGSICVFTDSEKDEDRKIESIWESRCETAGAPSIKKSVTKAGCALLLKKISNSRVEVYSIADTEGERFICSVNMGGFSFENMDFNSLSFSFGEDNLVAVPLNEKAFKTLKIKLRSDSSFGVAYVSYIAKLHNYIKN